MRDVPQTDREPLPVDDEHARRLLKKRRKKDRLDYFATDPDDDIRRLGRLALRRDDINDYFALGDMCARASFTDDQRLLVFYAGKTLIAYQRALKMASHEVVDRTTAERAIESYIGWVIDAAKAYPTHRNIAVALWVASDENSGKASEYYNRQLTELIEMYRGGIPSQEEHTPAPNG